jgi:hypothetical protein
MFTFPSAALIPVCVNHYIVIVALNIFCKIFLRCGLISQLLNQYCKDNLSAFGSHSHGLLGTSTFNK